MDEPEPSGPAAPAPQPRAAIAWSAEGAPACLRFGDIYFNPEDGRAESAFVYLHGVGLPERWRGVERFGLGELGFGLGLNFLTTWAAWRACPAKPRALDYIAFELAPPTGAEIRRAAAPWPDLAPLADRLAAAWPPADGAPLDLGGDAPRLTLHIGDARARVAALDPKTALDGWYLDGFAPAKNPEMWEEKLLAAVFARTAPGGRAATFTAAGAVRRGLQAAGFRVEKAPGFGRKRERLLAARA